MKDKQIVSGLEEFIAQTGSSEDSIGILNHIFEYHLVIQNKELAFNNLADHIHNAFEVNPNFLLEYLSYNKYFKIEDLSINSHKHVDFMESINILKKSME